MGHVGWGLVGGWVLLCIRISLSQSKEIAYFLLAPRVKRGVTILNLYQAFLSRFDHVFTGGLIPQYFSQLNGFDHSLILTKTNPPTPHPDKGITFSQLNDV